MNQQAIKAAEYVKAMFALTIESVKRQTADSIKFGFNSDLVDVAQLIKNINRALPVRPETFTSHNGYQASWDFDGHRVAVYVCCSGDSEITLMPDPNVTQ